MQLFTADPLLQQYKNKPCKSLIHWTFTIITVASPFPLDSLLLQYTKNASRRLSIVSHESCPVYPGIMQGSEYDFVSLSKGCRPHNIHDIASTLCSGLSTCMCAWNSFPQFRTQVDIDVIHMIKWNCSTFYKQILDSRNGLGTWVDLLGVGDVAVRRTFCAKGKAYLYVYVW